MIIDYNFKLFKLNGLVGKSRTEMWFRDFRLNLWYMIDV